MPITLHNIKKRGCCILIGTALILGQIIHVNAAEEALSENQNNQNIVVFSNEQDVSLSSSEQPPIFSEPPSDGDDSVTIMPDLPTPPEESPTLTPLPPENEPVGEITIEREQMKNAIKPGENFSFNLVFTNKYSNTDVTHVKLSLDLPSGILYTKDWDKETLNLEDISPLSQLKQKITLASSRELSNQPVVKLKASVTYKYNSNGKITDGKAEETLLLPVSNDGTVQDDPNSAPKETPDSYNPSGSSSTGSETSERKTIDPITPNIMVKRFTYKKGLKAGEDFTLELEFVNTSKKLAVENAIVNITPGEGLHIADDFSSFYIEKLNPGESTVKTIKMSVLPDGKQEGSEVALETKYEYVKGTERTQASISDKLGIAFQQTNRFSIGDIQSEKDIYANEETTISIPFVNKGKIPIYNLEARLETAADCQDTYKYLGNVESGTSGTVDFFITSQQAGKENIKVTLSYEDAQTRVKEEVREVVLNVQEPMANNLDSDLMGIGEENETENSGLSKNIFGSFYLKLGIIGAVLLLLFIFWKRFKKKKKSIDEVEL